MPPDAPPARVVRPLPGERDEALADVAAVRAIESAALSRHPPFTLMARAGEAAARLALAVAPHAGRVWIACGTGNNGGDGLVCATRLHQAGRRVVVTRVPTDAAREPADARRAMAEALAAGVPFADTPPPLAAGDLAVDALLGIGARRSPDGAVAALVARLNAADAPVLALDVPTGLDADTGAAAPAATVVAAHTLTYLVAKPGLFTGDGRDHAGRVWLADLGVATSGLDRDAGDTWLVGPPAGLRRRHRDHKGSLGDLVVVAGATGMSGAADLAAMAGHAAGAGRVWLHRLDGSGTGVAARPEIMAARDARGDAAAPAIDATAGRTVVAGCGGGDAIASALPDLLDRAGRLVLDADALNAIAGNPALRAALRRRTSAGRPAVLTPHPLEAARLLGRTTDDVQADRPAAARALAAATGAVVVLKGSGTLVAQPDGRLLVNPTGGPALATPGSGDVLAGWLAGTWTGRPDDGDGSLSARVAVWWHGRVAEDVRAGPLRAADLIEAMWSALARSGSA